MIVLDKPSTPWQLKAIFSAGAVFNAKGERLQVDSPDAIWQFAPDARWVEPAHRLVTRLKTQKFEGQVGEIICFSGDPGESIACSTFATRALGKESTALAGAMVSGVDAAVADASSSGYLSKVVALALDLPETKDLLPWQRTFLLRSRRRTE